MSIQPGTIDAIKRQNAEFDALTALCERWRLLRQIAVVDDDYPMMRHRYEGALREFLKAVANNRALDPLEPTPGGTT